MKSTSAAVLFFAAFTTTQTALAHRVYFEPQAKAEKPWQSPQQDDYSLENPAQLDNIWGSKALFGYLTAGDVDFYMFTINPADTFFKKMLIAMPLSPACNQTKNNYVNIALVGPGLPSPTGPLPFELPAGYGILVKENPVAAEDEQRDIFYEATSNISWFLPQGMTQQCITAQLPPPIPPMATCDLTNIFAQPIFAPVPYFIVVWDADGVPQDYTLSVGVVDSGYYYETPDQPLTVNNAHLHTPCTAPYPGG
jgi:hypothetical protein